MGPALRWLFQWPYRVILAGLFRLGLRAWQLTLLALVLGAVVGGLLLAGHYGAAAAALLAGGVLDIFDGALARLRGEAGPRGALLDSAVDRASDAMVFGSLFLSLAARAEEASAVLALVSLVAALMVSDLRAEAEAAGVPMSEGAFQRAERVVVLLLGLVVPGALLPALAVLAAMGAVTAVQRLVTAWGRLGAGPEAESRPPA